MVDPLPGVKDLLHLLVLKSYDLNVEEGTLQPFKSTQLKLVVFQAINPAKLSNVIKLYTINSQ